MSTNSLTVINEAAALVGDPAFDRINRDAWRAILNHSARDIARKLRLVLKAATFDLVLNDDEYAMPDDCWQVKSMRVNETPTDTTTWWWLKEMFEDEFRNATQGQFSTATRATRYFALTDTFHLYPRPDKAITGGGKIQYWGMPAEVTSEATQGIPLADIMRDTLRERMLVYALRRLEKFDAAAAQEQEWQASLTSDRDRIEDRSADRRSRIRTQSGNIFGQR